MLLLNTTIAIPFVIIIVSNLDRTLTLCSFTIRSTFLIESDLELCHHHQYDYKLPLSSFPELFPRERKEKGSEEISSYVGSHQQQTISDAFLHHDSRSVFRKGL